MSDTVLVSRDGAVATVTMNRPAARNALSQELRRALWKSVAELEADDTVAAIVLTGADPAFCAGLDLKELASTAGAALGETGAAGETSSQRGPVPPLTKPLIGAVNGVAVTGGFEVALACDFLIASEKAAFADTHARMGIMPGWGLTVLLPEAIGYRRAKELSTTGNFLDAQTALSWGLVNHVVPHAECVPFAQKLAADIASNDAVAVRQMLATYEAGVLVDREEAWAIEGRVAGEWQSGGRDGADLEARRKAVTERGRSQV
ncbi:enoyl-CoA hydratase [Actinospongicola halichondriae]|uniref:enoyl-CoA hydratase n=1 Tax=Actinospongicola halichondriae TaxID=3236844 RepID=UPI003D3A7281